jgi:hypothetical protein
VRTILVVMAVAASACGGHGSVPDTAPDGGQSSVPDTAPDATVPGTGADARVPGTAADAAVPDTGADAGAADAGESKRECVAVGGELVVVARAGAADEHAVAITAESASVTRWSEAGNEAVVLEVHGDRGLIGHLVLHQGRRAFAYTMHVGALAAGEALRVRVSALTATRAAPRACVTAELTAAATLGDAAEGLRRAPIFRWPAAKRFDDLPVVTGWSRATGSYQAVYTHENGGTVHSCGGGARGMEAEIARWGRGFDVEGVYTYAGATPTWGRCTGTAAATASAPRLEGAHPVFYYGDGHNRLFESRGGYGRACGSGGAERSDGDLVGWNVGNPGNDPGLDGAHVITLRPLPVDLDALGFAAHRGRREGLADTYAPWLYGLTWLELAREGRIDGGHTRSLDRYLFVDVRAADVDGSGDRVCSLSVTKGFVIRAVTRDGVTLSGPQMTASYFGADHDWKRIAIPLDRSYAPDEIAELVFDAYDDDGIYFLALGDAFLVGDDGGNGAVLAPVHRGERPIDVYVDDDRSGCTNDGNDDGPGGVAYPCVGSDHHVVP